MIRNSAELHLPEELLQKANLRGNEYAWPIDLIPEVITAAQKENLLNIGANCSSGFLMGESANVIGLTLIHANPYRQIFFGRNVWIWLLSTL